MNQDELVLNVDDLCVQFIIDGVLVEAVNGALAELIADGTVQAIINKYIPAE